MDELERAYHEIDRIQGIIDRHEGHMFSLRGLVFTALGGLVALYYTERGMESLFSFALVVGALVLAFLVAELRHVILVDEVVERSGDLERAIASACASGASGWYDGPRVNETCGRAVRRLVPRLRMTLMLNLFFYAVLGAAAVLIVYLLPRRV